MEMIKNAFRMISNALKNISNLGEFFQDDVTHTFSMSRLITFMVISTICFDAWWTLVIVKVAWNFTVNKLFFATIAIGGKVGEKLITSYFSRFSLTGNSDNDSDPDDNDSDHPKENSTKSMIKTVVSHIPGVTPAAKPVANHQVPKTETKPDIEENIQ